LPRIGSAVDSISASSRGLSPKSVMNEPDEPRSSGILNLVEVPRMAPYIPPPTTQFLSPQYEEPRSSGFLALDLVEQLNVRRTRNTNGAKPSEAPNAARVSPSTTATLSRNSVAYPRSHPGAPFAKEPAVGDNHSGNTPPHKRKYQADHMALDVLANVSVASPLIH